ncbi:MAG: uidA [Micrococcaceae bacterium]|jgi:hypothetical protein|nr:uidA [Micrococcaceae bacterium]
MKTIRRGSAARMALAMVCAYSTRRSSRSASCTTRTGSGTWCGGSSGTGASWVPGRSDTTRRRRRASSRSGYAHRVLYTDIYDCHSYEQDPAAFALEQGGLAHNEPFLNRNHNGKDYSVPYRGQPFFVSEFGGIWWNEEEAAHAVSGDDESESWGYGQRVAGEEDLYVRFEGLCSVLIDNPDMFGYC